VPLELLIRIDEKTLNRLTKLAARFEGAAARMEAAAERLGQPALVEVPLIVGDPEATAAAVREIIDRAKGAGRATA
jgi:hypothetical protein